MAETGAGFDAGHGGIFHAGADQSGTATGNQQVYLAGGGHQCLCGGTRGVLDQKYAVRGEARAGQTIPQCGDDGGSTAQCLMAAAQYAHVATFYRQRGGVGGDVGAALVNDGNHTHRHGLFLNDQPVGQDVGFQHTAHRVGQGGNITHTFGHGADAVDTQCQPVQHHRGAGAAGVFHIQPVSGQNVVHVGFERIGHRHQRRIALCAREDGIFFGGGCRQQFIQRLHGKTPFNDCRSGCLPGGPPADHTDSADCCR